MKKYLHLTFIFSLIIIGYNKGYSQTPNSWTQKASFGSFGRFKAVSFSIGSKGYVGTGVDQLGTLHNDFWEYNSNNNVWTQKANFTGAARTRAVGFCIGNLGYVGTGDDNISSKNDFWEYNPTNNNWTQKANFSGTARSGAVGFSIGNKGYIGTGNDGTFKNDFWEYNPTSNSWIQKLNFGGTARSGAVGFSIDGKGYIGTGGGSTSNKNDFWEYDPSSNIWIQKTDFGGTARTLAVGFSSANNGYIGTGRDAGNSLSDFWEYNIYSDTWIQKADFGGGVREDAIGFGFDDKGYIGTGLSSLLGNNDLWQFTPANRITIGALPGFEYCEGNSTYVPYTAIGVFNQGNVFTAQLSDENGSFSSPIDVGSISSTISDTINLCYSLPLVTTTGNHYRIRVVSSDPISVSKIEEDDITIWNLPELTITGTSSVCRWGTTILSISDNFYNNYHWIHRYFGTVKNSPDTFYVKQNTSPSNDLGGYFVIGEFNGCHNFVRSIYPQPCHPIPDTCCPAATSYCCLSCGDFCVTVEPVPVAQIFSSIGSVFICPNPILFYARGGAQYEFYKNGVIMQAKSTDSTFILNNPSNNDTVYVTAFNGDCSTVSSSIILHEAHIIASSNSPVCSHSYIQLSVETYFLGYDFLYNYYSWSGPNGFTSTLKNPYIGYVTQANSGIYTVIAYGNGCTKSASILVVVKDAPNATISYNYPICSGNTLQLFSSGGITYNWSSSNGFTSSLQNR